MLGPPPLRGEMVRAAELTGQLAVLLSANRDGLRVETLAPGGTPLEKARLELEGRRPDGSTFSLFPRSCSPGCATMRLDWFAGRTEFSIRAAAPGWRGGTRRVAIDWPPGPDATSLLDQVVAAMRAQPRVELSERVTSGPPGGAVTNAALFTGDQFLTQELYAGGGATDVRALPPVDGLAGLSFYIPGSTNWIELRYDSALRLRRELIVNPSHRITRTLEYPA